MDSFQDLFQLACQYCQQNLSEVAYNLWIRDIEPRAFDGSVASLYVSSEFKKNILEEKYLPLLKEAFATVVGFEVEVKLLCPGDGVPAAPQPGSQEEEAGEYAYTFDTFIVGANNKFAHAASWAVATNPANSYNPLFIYGGSGLGKTHLIRAICEEIQKNHPEFHIIYTKGEVFANELINAIQTHATQEFREKYRLVDLLAVDDVQFIGGKESTQEEFFHTFNALHESKKQIIISSDKPPKEIETLEERLRSRFEWGLTVDIQSPDYETRMAILRKKEDIEGYNIDNEVIKYIATNIKSNIRELEGALTKIVALSKLNHNKDINIALAEEALKDIISPGGPKEITPELIIQIVADHYNLTPLDLLSQKRNKEIAYPRQVAMYLCRSMTASSLQEIGKAMGGRDHSTIVHGIDKITADVEKNQTLQNTIEILKKKINPQ